MKISARNILKGKIKRSSRERSIPRLLSKLLVVKPSLPSSPRNRSKAWN